jgi:hypothetical protein
VAIILPLNEETIYKILSVTDTIQILNFILLLTLASFLVKVKIMRMMNSTLQIPSAGFTAVGAGGGVYGEP